jgi:hypothetical protein
MHQPLNTFLVSVAMASMLAVRAVGQPAGANYDESKVGSLTLPDPLTCNDGTKVTDAKMWKTKRRPEIVKLFETHVYGRSPERPRGMIFNVTSMDKEALGGKATRKEVTILFTGKTDGPKMDLLLYVPNGVKKPAPVFLGLNFNGNHSISADPGITLPRQWSRDNKTGQITNLVVAESTRAKEASRWPVEKIIARGYVLATAFYYDIEPDFADGWQFGVRNVLRPTPRDAATGSQTPATVAGKGAPADAASDDWGAIGAWAWGLSRALDYLETDGAIDAKHVAVMGHSRLGKTALWAGAQDERFAFVISNDSGEGGAALARRWFGETVERINTSFPHWFCGNFKKYNQDVNALPVDQHELIALMAPRPVYVASAEEDQWADPRGEFLSAKNAEPVYRLLGKDGLGSAEMPKVNEPVGKTIGYHIRTGKHDVTDYDWEQYMNFADRHFKSR